MNTLLETGKALARTVRGEGGERGGGAPCSLDSQQSSIKHHLFPQLLRALPLSLSLICFVWKSQ